MTVIQICCHLFFLQIDPKHEQEVGSFLNSCSSQTISSSAQQPSYSCSNIKKIPVSATLHNQTFMKLEICQPYNRTILLPHLLQIVLDFLVFNFTRQMWQVSNQMLWSVTQWFYSCSSEYRGCGYSDDLPVSRSSVGKVFESFKANFLAPLVVCFSFARCLLFTIESRHLGMVHILIPKKKQWYKRVTELTYPFFTCYSRYGIRIHFCWTISNDKM